MEIDRIVKKVKGTLLDPQKPQWIFVTLILIGIATLWLGQSSSTEGEPPEAPPAIDTFIPPGYVLVTLQLVNSDSINSMIGAYGLVDLYNATTDSNFIPSKEASPIAVRLRLIRAPNNQNLFGVLVPEDHRAVIQHLAGPVFAVIQGPDPNPRQTPVAVPSKKLRTITYGGLL